MNDELPIEFEWDFCIAIAMLEGKSFDEAKAQAREWVEEAQS